jgi:hypothetical protein
LCAHGVAGGRKFALRAASEPISADAAQHFLGDPQMASCISTAQFAPQPLTIKQVGPAKVEHDLRCPLQHLRGQLAGCA